MASLRISRRRMGERGKELVRSRIGRRAASVGHSRYTHSRKRCPLYGFYRTLTQGTFSSMTRRELGLFLCTTGPRPHFCAPHPPHVENCTYISPVYRPSAHSRGYACLRAFHDLVSLDYVHGLGFLLYSLPFWWSLATVITQKGINEVQK